MSAPVSVSLGAVDLDPHADPVTQLSTLAAALSLDQQRRLLERLSRQLAPGSAAPVITPRAVDAPASSAGPAALTRSVTIVRRQRSDLESKSPVHAGAPVEGVSSLRAAKPSPALVVDSSEGHRHLEAPGEARDRSPMSRKLPPISPSAALASAS